MNDLSIDVSYIGRLSTHLNLFKCVRKDVWNSRCPICGDSKKNKFKKRFYIFLNKDHYIVKCHNCGYTTLFSKFLEAEFPEIYKEYILEKLPQRSSLKIDRFKHIKESIPKKFICKGIDYSFLKQFNNLSKNHPARIYVESRQIPFDRVFYCPCFSDFILKLGMTKYILSYENAHEPRLIIPFYREDGLSTVFQARAFSKDEYLRYITIKEHEQESKIYGLERIDKNMPVWCTEGPIDAMMINNCLAMSGISTMLPKGISEFRFIYDNEPRNRDVVKSMKKRLLQGHKVVIFPDMIKYKDLNDFIVKGGIDNKKILDILENNLYSGSTGLLKLSKWRKS